MSHSFSLKSDHFGYIHLQKGKKVQESKKGKTGNEKRKKKHTLQVFLIWLSVEAYFQCSNQTSYNSTLVCMYSEPKDQLMVKIYGHLRSFLNICPGLSMCVPFQIPHVHGSYSNILFSTKKILLPGQWSMKVDKVTQRECGEWKEDKLVFPVHNLRGT